MCMYTCTCMSCIYSMSRICRYMYISVPSPRHHLARCQRQRQQYQMLEYFVWESRGNSGKNLKNFAHQRDILEPFDCFHTSAVLRTARCRTLPALVWLVYSRRGCRRGACCRRKRCKFSLAAMQWWSTVWDGSPELLPALRQPHVPPPTSDIPLILGRKNRTCCCGGKKNRDFETKWVDQSPQGDHYQKRDRHGSHTRSRNYSWKVREQTPLQEWTKHSGLPRTERFTTF